MAFRYAGNTVGGGGAPLVRNLLIGETLYTGQLLGTDNANGAGSSYGHVRIADAASEANENDQSIVGIALGVVNTEDSGWNSTNHGDTATFDVSQSTQILNYPKGATEVEVCIIIPWITKVAAPIYNAAYGTALTELEVTTASTTGLVVTHANDTVADGAGMDEFSTVYCRSGANRGHYRVVTTSATTSQTVLTAFPYDTAVGDVFVLATCVLGLGNMDIPATANCIDGNNDLDKFYNVYYHELDLTDSGREEATLTFQTKACEYIGC